MHKMYFTILTSYPKNSKQIGYRKSLHESIFDKPTTNIILHGKNLKALLYDQKLDKGDHYRHSYST